MKVLKKNAITAYKVFNEDWTCRDFKYEVGEIYSHKGVIGLCTSGYHCCSLAVNCFNYYSFSDKVKVAEVIIWGEVLGDEEDKYVSSKMKIVKELKWGEVLILVNSGYSNSGYRNSGDRNSGYWNSGNRNSGDSNSGNRNSGDWNSGDWNSGNSNSGNLNTLTPKTVLFFNKETKEKDISFPDCMFFDLTVWINEENMDKNEKDKNPKYEILGGYLKKIDYKEAFRMSMEKATKEEIEQIKKLPNFDADLFYEISGFKIK